MSPACHRQDPGACVSSDLADRSDGVMLGYSPAECLCSDCPSVLSPEPALNLAEVTHEHRAIPGPTSISTSHTTAVSISPHPLIPSASSQASPWEAQLRDRQPAGGPSRWTLPSPNPGCPKQRLFQNSLSKCSVAPLESPSLGEWHP